MTERKFDTSESARVCVAALALFSFGLAHAACSSPGNSPDGSTNTDDVHAADSRATGDSPAPSDTMMSGRDGSQDQADVRDATQTQNPDAAVADGFTGHDAADVTRPSDPCVQAGTCPTGTWINVTPSTLNLTRNFPYDSANYGVQDVLVDPVRPQDLYAFVCYQGVWKSTNYGQTWTHVSTGDMSGLLEMGRPWTAAIDPSPSRDPNTPPALYTVSGYGFRNGVYKSIDGGINWNQYDITDQTGQDVYSLDVDPYNSSHIIAGFHGTNSIAESNDAGETWHAVTTPDNIGGSLYVTFIDTGNGATTRGTWLTIAQWDNNSNGTWRTADGGTNWTQVGNFEHPHGCNQMFQAGGGVLYLPGQYGINKSTDYGATWASLLGDNENSVVGTPTRLYASFGWASLDPTTPNLTSTSRSSDHNWQSQTVPSAMTDGAKRAAVTFDGEHWVIVSGNWNAGLWRYIEP